MGCTIFFDDYSNCLIVGNTMRPLTDRLRVSREKLAYIVDSTAAPVAGLSFLSTWVAFEVSTFGPHLPAAGIHENPYAIFFQSLPFRYYSLFTLGLVALVILTGRDFGPMRRAEARARTTGELIRRGASPTVSARATDISPDPGVRHLARNAVLPVLAVIAVTLEEIFRRGGGYALLQTRPEDLLRLEPLTGLLLEGGGAAPLFAGATCGLALAALLVGSNALRVSLVFAIVAAALGAAPLAGWLEPAVGADLAGYAAIALLLASVGSLALALLQRLPTKRAHLASRAVGSAAAGSARSIGVAVVLLFEAWMIGAVCRDAGTADYLLALLSGAVAPAVLPVLLFGIACVVSFSTGTSWGTMSILLPNVVALAAAVGAQQPDAAYGGAFGMVVICIGAVLEGSIFGDHCSPISDTTVLSSVASASDHLDHVRTQAPYALLAAGLAIGVGYLPAVLIDGWSLPFSLAAAALLALGFLYVVGRRPPEVAPDSLTNPRL